MTLSRDGVTLENPSIQTCWPWPASSGPAHLRSPSRTHCSMSLLVECPVDAGISSKISQSFDQKESIRSSAAVFEVKSWSNAQCESLAIVFLARLINAFYP